MTHSPQPWLSVVIPIKDERDNLRTLTRRLIDALSKLTPPRPAPFEIMYVDDGSTDGSAALLDEICRDTDAARVIHLDRNHGKTAALDAGFRHTSGDVIVTLDGDLQNDPDDIATLLPLTAHYDCVCGHRLHRHDNIVRRLSSRLAYRIRHAVLRDGIHDTGCGFKVFRRRVIERIPLFHNMHRFFPALVAMYGFSVTEAPVRHFPRLHGHSKYGVGNRLFASLYDLIAVRWMQRRCIRYDIVRTPPDAASCDPPA